MAVWTNKCGIWNHGLVELGWRNSRKAKEVKRSEGYTLGKDTRTRTGEQTHRHTPRGTARNRHEGALSRKSRSRSISEAGDGKLCIDTTSASVRLVKIFQGFSKLVAGGMVTPGEMDPHPNPGTCGR